MRTHIFAAVILTVLACTGAQPAEGLRLAGLLADAARAPESPAYYRRLIDFCHDWGLNALIFRIADDQGVAVRFASHPELITHRNALTPQQARELAEYARDRGVELIPEIESFGHTSYITRTPEHADLLDRQDPRSHFTGLIPVEPKSIRIISDLYREAATIFPSRYLHGGCDEVNWGGSQKSVEALKTRSRAAIWADYVNALNKTVMELNKELIIWGDHVLRLDPEILGRLDKRIILHDWEYSTTDPAELETVARKALSAGFRVIGGPALIWCKWGPRAGSDQLRNIDAFASAYRKIEDPKVLGVLVTNWTPGRFMPQSLWDGLAYAAVAITEGVSAARDSAFRRFAERHYGAEWNDTWADIFRTYYDIAPNRRSCSPSWMGPRLPVPWSDETGLAAVVEEGMLTAPPFTRLRSQTVLVEPSVRKNLGDFRAFQLSARYIEQLFWRNTVVAELARKGAGDPEIGEAFRAIAERDRALLDSLRAEWDETRPPDSPARTEPMFDGQPEDQLLFRFEQAAAFSQKVANNPEKYWPAARAAAGRREGPCCQR